MSKSRLETDRIDEKPCKMQKKNHQKYPKIVKNSQTYPKTGNNFGKPQKNQLKRRKTVIKLIKLPKNSQ